MTSSFEAMCWPAARTGEALEALARKASLRTKSTEALRPPAWLLEGDEERLHEWIEAAAASLGLEGTPVQTTYADVRSFIATCGPALIRLEFERKPLFLAVISARRGSVRVLTPELKTERVAYERLRSALCDPLEAPLLPEIERILDEADIKGRKISIGCLGIEVQLYSDERRAVSSAILHERLGAIPIPGCWLIRVASGDSVRQQISEARLLSRLALFISAHTVDALLVIASWWLIGRAVLQGRLDYGLLFAWVLLMLTRIPFRLVETWMQGRVAIGGGAVLKRRLLAGTLRLRPEEIRHEGVGQLLGRVIESEALETLALTGGLTALTAVIEIVIAAGVLALPANNIPLAVLLLLWTVVVILLALWYTRRRKRWTETRLDITSDLIERMAGHRTRLAQEAREHWHEAEDESLERYLQVSRRMDRGLVALMGIVPRGWLILGLVPLIYAAFYGNATATNLAVAFGGLLLAQGALRSLTQGTAYLGSAVIAWQQVKLLFAAAARQESGPAAELGFSTLRDERPAPQGRLVMEAHDVAFRHQGRATGVLDGLSMRIREGDRILLEGPSGGGKSTLVSLLAGIREPQSGLVMLRGLDRRTFGPRAWRKSVALAPQFHENHVMSGTLAFNLLMARRWPPRPEDLEEAEKVCREVGLGDLLGRMPAGLLQQVGETGWQLSHGERSRLFLARALLQGADVVILDESFGALDPETLEQAMHCARGRAETLMVVAHP